MLVFVAEKTVRSNLKKFNVRSFDKAVFERLNASLLKFAVHELSKKRAMSGGGCGCGTKNLSMMGGRVLMPAEFFGATTNHYVPEALGQNMGVTEQFIRPAMDAHMAGGGDGVFRVSERAVRAAVSEALLKLGKQQKVSGDHVRALKAKYEALITAAVAKAAKKLSSEGHLKNGDLKAVLDMKKFAALS